DLGKPVFTWAYARLSDVAGSSPAAARCSRLPPFVAGRGIYAGWILKRFPGQITENGRVSGGQCFIDPPVGGLIASVDALRIHPQQHLQVVTCTVSHLRGRDPAVQPERDGTVTQVVGP